MGQNVARLEILNGWKEIASYLGKGVRTVQRYERVLGLPVRRPGGKSIASVIATKVELDAWIASAPIREQFQLTTAAIDNTSLVNEFKSNTERLYLLGLKNQELGEELATSMKLVGKNIHRTVLESNHLNHVPSKRLSCADVRSKRKATNSTSAFQSVATGNFTLQPRGKCFS